MRGRLPIITPPGLIIAILVVPLLGFLTIGAISDVWVSQILGTFPTDGMLAELLRDQSRRAPFCLMFALLYGGFRATSFHPAFRPGYREWLADTPWTSRLPLPLGPIHLVWQDLYFVVPPMVIAWGADLGFVLAVPILFMWAYSACVTLSLFVTRQRGIAYVIAFVAGLAVYLAGEAIIHETSLWPTLAVVIVVYALLAWGLQRSLARFEKWDGACLSLLDLFGASFRATYGQETQHSQAAGQLGWPFDGLPLRMRYGSSPIHEEVVFAVLAGWWLYAAHVNDIFLSMLLSVLLGMPFVIAVMIWFVCRPPISYWGRLRTGRLIIPRYDRCFLWPAVLLAVQWGWLRLAEHYTLPLPLVTAVQMMLFIGCACRVAAAFERFQLTGAYRIPIPFTLSINKQLFTRA